MDANLDTLAIPVGYIVLATILLWFVILSRGYWWLKTLTITGTLIFGLILWYSVDSYLGWPSSDQIPRKFVVHWGLVNEPSKTSDDPGCIYLWVTQLKVKADIEEEKNQSSYGQILAYQNDKPRPRAYKLPYSDKMRTAVGQAKKIIKEGGVVIGERGEGDGFASNGKGKGKGKGKCLPGEGKGKDGKFGSFSFSHSDDIYFHELPPPKVPEKLFQEH